MKSEHLVQMANQIGLYHAAFPDHREAVDGVYLHIRRSWEPRMRKALYAHLDQHAGEGLHPLVLEAMTTHRADLEPKPTKQKVG